MIWYELAVTIREEASEAVTHYLNEQGANGVSIEQSWYALKNRQTRLGEWYDIPFNDIPEGKVVIKAYFPATDSDQTQSGPTPSGASVQHVADGLRDFISQLSEYGIEAGQTSIEIRSVKDEDWAEAWKQYYKPVKISERLTVKPVWEPYEPHEHEIVIELDPGMAFGTGTHATTVLCLQMLEQYVKPGEDVIDVGTGSGILAIAAAKLGARHVLALDLDPVAVASAQDNVRQNGLAQITVKESDLLSILDTDLNALGIELPVQLVVSNILAEIIVSFVDDVQRVLRQGGLFIASGIITAKESLVTDRLQQAGFSIVDRKQKEDWVVLVARKD
jgi:ribosomal protein L11 methyltransferase